MGRFDARHLRVYGCLVGDYVYVKAFSGNDVVLCILPRLPSPGEKLSVVLHNDDHLRAALLGPVPLRDTINLTLSDDDVPALSQSVKVHGNPKGGDLPTVADLRAVRSTVTYAAHYVNMRAVAAGVERRPVSASDVANGSGDEDRPTIPSHAPAYMREGHPFSVVEPALAEVRSAVRYETCLVTMMKQFHYLLPEWIAYHRRLGIDHVVLFDNNATVDLAARYGAHPDVDVVNWPAARSQVQALSLALHAARTRCEWVFMFDADEYVMVGLGRRRRLAGAHVLKEVLAMVTEGGYDLLSMKYLTMGPSGHVHRPATPVPEAYVARLREHKVNVKSGYYTDMDWMLSNIHTAKSASWPRLFPKKGDSDRPVRPDQGARIVHYQFRSMEDWLLKIAHGSGSTYDLNLDMNTGPKKRHSLDKPLSMYKTFPEHLRYEYFRDLYRAVMQKTKTWGARVVRWRGDSRCVVEYDAERKVFGQEKCVTIASKM